ncbi:ethanolamine utilization phosphate acetyltransferase EutD [Hathewaya limosa]|uniref:Phosphate propanoyltransferase n=1 Tax=Hathewaya limosa TaxID=1536 RepID=A0ABU0JSC7_HATLI|nr:ethanolamine utilization phosphate acetyltransferase EutD [Hathewaya limosa]MDQ0480001.1 propanediol utilization protein [Hathewaya limosa]
MSSLEQKIEYIVEEVVKRLKNQENTILVEASGRHVHLSQEHIDLLFGKGYELTKVKELSQPGQYACKERVSLIGPKGMIQNVVVLGPARKETQVELSKSDCVILGTKVPVRMSGDLKGSAPIVIATEKGIVQLPEGAIAAKRHIHISPEDAKRFNIEDKQVVKLKIEGERSLIFDEVVVRVSPNFNTAVHIDYDEANACGFVNGTRATIIK